METPGGRIANTFPRRQLLQRAGGGIGMLALNSLLLEEGLGATTGANPMATRQPHGFGRAKRVSKPPALFVEEQYGFAAEAQGYTQHLKRKRTENPPTPQTAPAQAEVPADPAATAAPAPAAAAPAAPAESPIEVQLAKLKKMKTKELIDEATYAQMCKAALDADHAAFLKTLGA